MRSDDKSLPLVVRNILARDEYEKAMGSGNMNTLSAVERRNEQLLECYLALAFEKMCPYWGGALPYNGDRRRGIYGVCQPIIWNYSARYNLFMSGDLVKENGPHFEDLIATMVWEFMYEIRHQFEGKNKKFYPLIPARPIYALDIASMDKSVRFQGIFYAAKPFDFDLSNSPEVPVTRARPGFCGHLMQFPLF